MTTYYTEGDALLAERVAVQARRIDKGPVTQASGRHKIQTAKLRGSAYCVIEKPLRTSTSSHRNTILEKDT